MKSVYIIFVLFALFSCQSVERYNAHLETKIDVKDLQEDVDFAYQKLKNKQPDLDWFVPMHQLDFKFDSFRKAIQKPMKSIEFYHQFAQVVGEIGQAHTFLIPPMKKMTKKENKAYKETIGPFSQLGIHFEPEFILLTANNSDDKSIPLGEKITHVNNHSVKDLYQKYSKTEYSDGYNTTFVQNRIRKNFSHYFTLEYGIQDTLKLQFEIKDSVFIKKVFRKSTKKDKNIKITKSDSVQKPKTSKTERKKIKLKQRNFGYDFTKKNYAIELSFPTQDSTVAVLKIRNFTKGVPKKAYREVFESIANYEVKDLILDVRNNGGGYAKDARELFAYFYKDEIPFTQKAKVTSKTSIAFSYPQMLPWAGKIIGFPFWLSASVGDLVRTQKQIDGEYYYKIFSSKPYKIEDNHYEGNLYVLINGGSFSATSLLISMLDQYTDAIFVGEESGGNYTGTVAGRLPVYRLPNSKLNLRVGLMSFRPNLKIEESDGHGKFPDVEVIPTEEDIRKRRDPQLKTVLSLIEQNQ